MGRQRRPRPLSEVAKRSIARVDAELKKLEAAVRDPDDPYAAEERRWLRALRRSLVGKEVARAAK